MKRKSVVVPWRHGLHLRPAAILAQAAKRFRSTIYLRYGEKIADLRNILSVVTLCATMGVGLDIEVSGDDEHEAAQAIEQIFANNTETVSSGGMTQKTSDNRSPM